MKGKILSVLFSLMLVFGMIFAACDNGVQPDDPYKSDPSKGKALDFTNAGAGYAVYETSGGKKTGEIKNGNHGDEKLNGLLETF